MFPDGNDTEVGERYKILLCKLKTPDGRWNVHFQRRSVVWRTEAENMSCQVKY